MKYLIIDKRQRVEVSSMGDIPTGSARLVEELEKKNIPNDFVYNDELEFIYEDGDMNVLAKGTDVTEYTHIIFRGHSLDDEAEYQYKRYIIDYIEEYNKKNNTNILVQNSEAIKNFPYYNKIALATFCFKNNLPHFDTYYRTDGEYIKERGPLNSYPVIMKDYVGRNRLEMIDGKERIKKNVFKIDSDEDFNMDDIDPKNFFLQRFSDKAEDYRLFVSNGKVIGGWKRIATDSFMTVSKGEYVMYNTPDSELKELAERVSSILDADFIAVDFMYIGDKVCIQEFSFHPGYKAYETKIEGEPANIAESIINAFKK